MLEDEPRPKGFPPFSLRLSFDERAQLETEAGNMALGAYIRERLLGDPTPRKKRRKPIKDETALSQLLGELSRSNIANNLNQLAKAAHSGSLDVTPDTERAIREAYSEIMWMRSKLMQALGFDPEAGKNRP